jgi:hypothetical protein
VKKAIAWQIDGTNTPTALEEGKLDLEKRLEDWVEKDPSIVADDVLIIGRQAPTKYGTVIDLLGIDAAGNLVIIELKRDQTLRETIAQGIEYAAWASKLGRDDVLQRGAQRYGSEGAFQTAFESQFGGRFPDTVNESQRILLVAPEITDATAEVIEYLAETYRVPINAVSFDLFSLDSRQVLVRHLVLEQSETPQPPGTKKRSPRTLEEFAELAGENGVGELLKALLTLRDILPSVERFISSLALRGKTPDKRLLAGLSIYPTAETAQGAIVVSMSPENIAALYSIELDRATAFVQGLQALGSPYQSWPGWIRTSFTALEQVNAFVARVRAFANAPQALTLDAVSA